MKRVAQVIGLPPEKREEYERYHAAVWPTILDRLARSNIHNYSIYRHGDLLFSYFEYTGDDYEADQAAIAADPETQRWWALQEPLQRPLDDRADGEWWKELPEVFHVDQLDTEHNSAPQRSALRRTLASMTFSVLSKENSSA